MSTWPPADFRWFRLDRSLALMSGRPVTPPPAAGPSSQLDLTPEQVRRLEENRLKGAPPSLDPPLQADLIVRCSQPRPSCRTARGRYGNMLLRSGATVRTRSASARSRSSPPTRPLRPRPTLATSPLDRLPLRYPHRMHSRVPWQARRAGRPSSTLQAQMAAAERTTRRSNP